MGKVKGEFIFAAIGVFLGACVLLLKLFVFSANQNLPSDMIVNETLAITYPAFDKNEIFLASALQLFGFNADAIGDVAADGDGLLGSLENLKVKIVANADIASEQYTLLEVTGETESKRLLVKEGTIIEGLLVKTISNKYIVLEKNGVEYAVKLFHPENLNLTGIDTKNETE